MPNTRRSRSAHGKRCRRRRLWPLRCGARRVARARRSACWRHTAAIADVAALSAPAPPHPQAARAAAVQPGTWVTLLSGHMGDSLAALRGAA
jgi:hypothetical protein